MLTMTHRFGTVVAGALAGALALGSFATPAHAQNTSRDTSKATAQDTTHHARTHKVTKSRTTRTWQKRGDSTAMKTDTAAYRSMDSRTDTIRVTTDTVKADSSAHFNRDSAQTAPRATTSKGLPGMQGNPAGAGSPGIVTAADTTGNGANSAGGTPGGPPVTTHGDSTSATHADSTHADSTHSSTTTTTTTSPR